MTKASFSVRLFLCWRVSCSQAHNFALYLGKVSDVSPTAWGLLHGERDRGEKGTGETVTQVIERVEAHYEVQRVEMGTVYRWCPESVVIECECGERATLTASRSACGECEADHEATTEEVLDVRQEDKVDHPWRSVHPYYTPIRGT
jgi:hypothetical protein